ncbi:MAG TPA: hypothetical protein VG538_06020 [Vicinamibacterales bacterium]|jgi:hypothetical protein|nr:hypothetical protein [Vicinamibacterales bacterium]
MPPITDPVVIAVVRQVQRELTPENYDQRQWCGTACCIAGHIERVARQVCPDRLVGDTHCERAAEVLGIDADLADGNLFDASPYLSWPAPFSDDWDDTMDQFDRDEWRVAIARRRLDYFLETGE